MRANVAWVLGVALVPSVAWGALGGRYDTPLGPVDLKVAKGKVTAMATGDGGPCAFKKGQTILKGGMLDDSVSGKLSMCTDGCGNQDAFVVLLVAQNGDLLSGAVQLKDKKCKLPLAGKGIAFARAAKSGKGAQPVAKAARVKKQPAAQAASTPSKGKTDPNGTAASAAPAPAAAEEPAPATDVKEKDVAAPFANWNPEAASRGGGEGGRKVALMRGRDAAKALNSGQFEAARPLLMEALRADPGYAEGYNMMGVTYYARDSYDDALDWYKKALTANPDFGDAYYNIACIYAVEGKKPLALRYLRIALLNGYTQKEAIQKDPDLDPLREDPEYKEIMAQLDPPAPAATPTSDGGAAEQAAGDAGVTAQP